MAKVFTDEEGRTKISFNLSHREAFLLRLRTTYLPGTDIERINQILPEGQRNEEAIKNTLALRPDLLLLEDVIDKYVNNFLLRQTKKQLFIDNLQMKHQVGENPEEVHQKVLEAFQRPTALQVFSLFLNELDAVRVQPIEPEKKKKKGAAAKNKKAEEPAKNLVKFGGHFIDNILFNPKKLLKAKQPEFVFSEDEDAEASKQLQKEYQMLPTVVKGLQLSVHEDKLMNKLIEIMHNRIAAEKLTTEIVPAYFRSKEFNAPVLELTQHQLISAYTGRYDYSGKEVLNVGDILMNLANKNFWISYRRTYKKDGQDKIDRVDKYEPLISIGQGFKELTAEEDRKLTGGDLISVHQKRVILLKLHPVVVDQMDTKFISKPANFDEMLEMAVKAVKGLKGKVTEAEKKLSTELLRQISGHKHNGRRDEQKRAYWHIDKENLPYHLGLSNKADKKDWSYVWRKCREAADVSKRLGLLLEYEEVTGARGQLVCRYYYNSEFIKQYKLGEVGGISTVPVGGK
jgi:hypothetical protein